MTLGIVLIVVAALLGLLARKGFNTRNKHGGYTSWNPIIAFIAAVFLLLGLLALWNFVTQPQPVAKIHAAFTYHVSGLKVTFDGSPSHAAKGKIKSYKWDFGDGSTDSGKTATHTFAQGDQYSVILVVTGMTGVSDDVTRVITVGKQPSASPTPTPTPSDTPSSSPVPSSTSNANDSFKASGRGTASSPRRVAPEQVGPGGCLPGAAILQTLRADQPNGEDFQAPYDQYELNVLVNTEITSVEGTGNQSRPCVRALARSFGIAVQDLPAYMHQHLHLIVVGPRGLTVENTYYDRHGNIVRWQVQTFPPGELVWEDAQSVPVIKFVCGNRLYVVYRSGTTVVSTPSSTPTQSTPSHSPVTRTPTRQPTSRPPTHQRPTPTPTPRRTRHKNGRRTPRSAPSNSAPGKNPAPSDTTHSQCYYNNTGKPAPGPGVGITCV